jgi:hypothetical protein
VRKFVLLIAAVATLPACNDTPATADTALSEGSTSAASQQEDLAKQKLTIEQAAEEATQLIEADAKAEIDAATSEPAQ